MNNHITVRSGKLVTVQRDPTQPIDRIDPATIPGSSLALVLVVCLILYFWRREAVPGGDEISEFSPPGTAEPRITRPATLDPVVAGLAIGSGVTIPLVLDPEIVADLAAMPHLLVAGSSGSGKSVAIHAMIQGLLAKGSTDLVLIDPKRVEAAIYRDNGRVELALDSKSALLALERLVQTMEARYSAMACNRQRHWQGDPIVCVIDEFGDLVLGDQGKAISKLIAQLAQKARAAAIHLILATQRPSSDVVTGLIKANFPARLALRTASAVDSRVILECGDAVDLPGNGHGLLRLPGQPIVSVRAPFVDPFA